MSHPEIRRDTGPDPNCCCTWKAIVARRGGTGDPDWHLDVYDPRCQADHPRPEKAS